MNSWYYVPMDTESLYREQLMEGLRFLMATLLAACLVLPHRQEGHVWGSRSSWSGELFRRAILFREIYGRVGGGSCAQSQIKSVVADRMKSMPNRWLAAFKVGTRQAAGEWHLSKLEYVVNSPRLCESS